MMSTVIRIVLTVLSLLHHATATIDPIVIKGSKFFLKSNGTQFFIKGVAYQQNYDKAESSKSDITYTDPLADKAKCSRDIPLLQALQTNTIRVYAIDPTANHDDCMSLFADAGIYIVADLASPSDSIQSNDLAWTTRLLARYTSVIDALAKYDNTLGFFAGNEVSDRANNTFALSFVKAAVRDTKKYIKDKGYREMGVGYACTDTSSYLDAARFLTCGSKDVSIDFFGYNIYSWCGDSNPVSSSYDQHIKEFANYPVPAFFAEYGCNQPEPRMWGDTNYLYGPNMSQVWSGGIVYEYFPAENNFGLVGLQGSSVTPNLDYDNLKTVISSVTPTGTTFDMYQPNKGALSDCPDKNSNWTATASPLPPTPDVQLCSCMFQSLSCSVKASVAQKDYGKLFNFVCGSDSKSCDGIARNATAGMYGAYSPCNSTEQLFYALDQYYRSHGSSAQSCDFQGMARFAQPAALSDRCKALMSAASNATSSGKRSDGIRSYISSMLNVLGTTSLSIGVYLLF